VQVVVDLVLVLIFDLGVQGLALGHAAHYLVGSIALTLLIRRRLHGVEGGRVAASIGRTGLAGAATAGAAWLVAGWLGDAVGTTTIPEQAAQVFGAVAAGLAVFVLAATLLRIEEVAMVRRQVFARWRK